MDSTNVAGPNCGSGAARYLTIGPVYGPEKMFRLLESVSPHGALYDPARRSACLIYIGFRACAVPDRLLFSLPRIEPMPRLLANAVDWMNDAGSFGCHVPSRC